MLVPFTRTTVSRSAGLFGASTVRARVNVRQPSGAMVATEFYACAGWAVTSRDPERLTHRRPYQPGQVRGLGVGAWRRREGLIRGHRPRAGHPRLPSSGCGRQFRTAPRTDCNGLFRLRPVWRRTAGRVTAARLPASFWMDWGWGRRERSGGVRCFWATMADSTGSAGLRPHRCLVAMPRTVSPGGTRWPGLIAPVSTISLACFFRMRPCRCFGRQWVRRSIPRCRVLPADCSTHLPRCSDLVYPTVSLHEVMPKPS